MNQNMGRLIRYILIIQRLSGRQMFVPSTELISFLDLQMELRGYKAGLSLRTLQRDIIEIGSMFDIEIKNRRGKGYYISEKIANPGISYEDLLMNFDLLTSLNGTSDAVGFILPEHHRPVGASQISTLIYAIKNNNEISFNYRLIRKGDQLIHRRVRPHFLKESLGLWYLLALDSEDKLKVYGVDRISDLIVEKDKFIKEKTIDPNSLFKNSYGIWDDETMPIEEVELSYSPLDGNFLKTMPLHISQEILVDNESEFRIRLRIRITNDFVMALLARSNSITVIRPNSLRERIRNIYHQALIRNS